MGLMLREGDQFEMKGRIITVTKIQAAVGQRVRDELIEVAKRGDKITYGALKHAAGLSHPPNGMGRLLDVISEDCRLREEPSLAPLVVNSQTCEVGADYEGDPVRDRRSVYDYWS
ncbi:MAG: hypothetical protein ACSLEW_00750 [Nocardioides sp.]